MRDDTVEKLRKILPPLLTVKQYCALMNRCEASAYCDLKNKPGIAVKVGGSTRFVTDAVLDEMLRLPAWIPQKDRTRQARPPRPRKPPWARRQSDKQTAAPRREREART